MANFISRNVLICVVPAVIFLFSVYWFKKKKKMKPDSFSPIISNKLCNSKLNETLHSQDSIYSSIDPTSDFSNTLSDSSSISSPENCVRIKNTTHELSNDSTVASAPKISVSMSNHVDNLNLESSALNSVENHHIDSSESVIENARNIENIDSSSCSEVKDFIPDDCISMSETNDNFLLKDVINMTSNVYMSMHQDLLKEGDISENEHIKNSENYSKVFKENDLSYNDILNFQNDESKNSSLDLLENSDMTNVISEEIAVKLQNALNTSSSKNDSELQSDIAVSADIHDSHFSDLNETSLNCCSDDSEHQMDYKKKKLPIVFDTNSVNNKEEKNNEPLPSSQSVEKDKNNLDEIASEVHPSSYEDNRHEQYTVQLNRNSFFIGKTISSNNAENEPSSSNSPVSESANSLTSFLQNSHSLQNSSSDESCPANKDDSGIINECSSVSKTLNDNLDYREIHSRETSDILLCSKASTFEDISSIDCETISSTSGINSCLFEDKSSDQQISDDMVSSTVEETTESKGSVELNRNNQLDSTSNIQSNSLAEDQNLKAQYGLFEELNQEKKSEFEGDIKNSGLITGPFVYEFELPQELCGRLIGKQGKHVKSIKERTNANVLIKRHPFDTNLKTVVVEGGRTAVHEALDIIRRKFPPSQFPNVSLLQTNLVNSHTVSVPEYLQLHLPEGASCDVILSSLVNAGHFFLQQPTHPTYPSLSTLDQCMINCYSQMDTPLLPHPVEAGVICAAPVMNGWFRAQVIYVYENGSECEIKFVDYGGFSQVLTTSLRQIRSDFMTLPFQASECYLANVRPIDCNSGWSSEATSVFEELAQGQILQALLVEYAEDGVPCVHLYRVQGVTNMFINRELVERGLAVWVDNNPIDTH